MEELKRYLKGDIKETCGELIEHSGLSYLSPSSMDIIQIQQTPSFNFLVLFPQVQHRFIYPPRVSLFCHRQRVDLAVADLEDESICKPG